MEPVPESTHRCIWCLQDKETAAFNREHVIPQAFGTFESNFTLVDAVCVECNSFFSRELEPTLARDTLEGFQRFQHGQKPKNEFKSLGKRSVTKVQIPTGLYAGAWGYAAAGEPELRITPFPQVGFAKTEDGPFDWHPLEDLPTSESMKAKGFGTCYLRFCECSDLDEVKRLLLEKGFPWPETTTFAPPSGLTPAEFVFRAGTLLQRRGWAKVLFNYLAHTAGVVAVESRFDPIRYLVLRGVEPAYRYYALDTRAIIDGDKTENKRFFGHIVEVHCEDGAVIGTVSLYNTFRHQFLLARPPGSEIAPSGHFFDFTNRVIVSLRLKGTGDSE